MSSVHCQNFCYKITTSLLNFCTQASSSVINKVKSLASSFFQETPVFEHNSMVGQNISSMLAHLKTNNFSAFQAPGGDAQLARERFRTTIEELCRRDERISVHQEVVNFFDTISKHCSLTLTDEGKEALANLLREDRLRKNLSDTYLLFQRLRFTGIPGPTLVDPRLLNSLSNTQLETLLFGKSSGR